MCFFFCLYGVKILVLFQRKGPQKEKRMAKNNILYIIMYTSVTIYMVHFCHPQLIQTGYGVSVRSCVFNKPAHLVKYI